MKDQIIAIYTGYRIGKNAAKDKYNFTSDLLCVTFGYRITGYFSTDCPLIIMSAHDLFSV